MPFEKGKSGNPKGRPPKGYSITEWFQDMLGSDPEAKEKMGRAIWAKALRGDIAAQKLVWNYMDGMPQHDVTSGGEKIEGLVIVTNESETEQVADESIQG